MCVNLAKSISTVPLSPKAALELLVLLRAKIQKKLVSQPKDASLDVHAQKELSEVKFLSFEIQSKTLQRGFLHYLDEETGKCVRQEQCPCMYDGKIFQNGAKNQPDNCNECTCMGGEWSCTDNVCPAECSSIGDPHFTTFDGKTFDFQVCQQN